ncbi:MAG: hypothetical protein P8Q97_05065 [Myxococcota bacterium]|jgi:hypothetical protein|nr:hypothetical protein [Myxococcota bacterium]
MTQSPIRSRDDDEDTSWAWGAWALVLLACLGLLLASPAYAESAWASYAPSLSGSSGMARAPGASPFQGEEVTASWEYWTGASPGAGGIHLVTTDTVVFTAEDTVGPDWTGFHTSTGTLYELWDIDVWQDEIRLTYTSAAANQLHYEYMYFSPVGFHFEDTSDQWPAITNVTVDTSIAPFGFNPANVTFDDDNIWVDLAGSMCHLSSMGSMPACLNPLSPTGYDNEVVLIVETVPEPGLGASLFFGVLGLLGFSRRQHRGATPARESALSLAETGSCELY